MKPIKINLLPGAARFQLSQIRLAEKLRRIAYLVLFFWLALVIVVFLLKGVLGYQEKKLVAQKKQLEASIKEFSPQVELQQALRFRLKLTAETLTGRSSMAEKIQEIESLLPEGSLVRVLKIKSNDIEVSGKISTLLALAEFERRLDKIAKKEYSDAKVESLSKEDDGWSFILKLKR